MTSDFIAILGMGFANLAGILSMAGLLIMLMGKLEYRLGQRIDRVEERFDRGFDGVDSRFDRGFDGVGSRFDRVDARFDRVDARFDQMEERLQRLEQGQARLEGEMTIIRETLFARPAAGD